MQEAHLPIPTQLPDEVERAQLARSLADMGINPLTLRPWGMSEEAVDPIPPEGYITHSTVGGATTFVKVDKDIPGPSVIPVRSLSERLRKYLQFIPDALAAAGKSKDSRQVGCVVIDDDYCVRTSGWNGFPRGVKHLKERDRRPTKYSFSAHAEENAIAQAARIGVSLKGCTLLLTALYPCSTCARLIIQSGITTVIAPDVDMPEKWALEWVISKEMFAEAGVKVFAYNPEDHSQVQEVI